MQKAIKIILSMLLAGVFLLSFTGLRLLLHHCMSCDSYEIQLFSNVEKCCPASEVTANLESSCCMAEPDSQGCCSNHQDAGKENSHEACCEDKVVYIQKDFEFVNGTHQPRLEQPVMAHFGFFNHLIESAPLKTIIKPDYIEPPPKYVGKQFVLFSHQIKIG
jgi:hypothetical protein